MWIFLLTMAREPGAGWSLCLISADFFGHAPSIKVLVWGLRPCCPACSFPSSWVAAYCFHHLRKQSLPVFLLLSPGCIWFFIVLFLPETFAAFESPHSSLGCLFVLVVWLDSLIGCNLCVRKGGFTPFVLFFLIKKNVWWVNSKNLLTWRRKVMETSVYLGNLFCPYPSCFSLIFSKVTSAVLSRLLLYLWENQGASCD